MQRAIAVTSLLSGLFLAGCSVGPDYQSPFSDLQDNWHQGQVQGLAPGEADVETWWEKFEDPMLNSLVQRAAEGNLELRSAILRVRQARALRGVAAGELLPQLSGQASYQRTRMSGNSFIGSAFGGGGRGQQFSNTVTRGVATGALTQGITSVAPGAGLLASPLASGVVGLLPTKGTPSDLEAYDMYSSGFDASWEIDIFGGIRRNVESADAELEAAFQDYRDVQVSLLAEVASSYIDVRTLQAQVEATKRNIELQKETLELAKARANLELDSELAVRQAETNLATTESQLPQLQAAVETSIYRLSVLVGEQPQALYGELIGEQPIPNPPANTFVGVPTDLLRRRPDIRSAERALASATAQIGVAASDLYPKLTLSGTFGFDAVNLANALDGRSMSYGFGPAVRWNIFDGLRNLNRIAAQEAATQQAFTVYEQTVLTALQEVETAMVNYKREQDRRASLEQAAEAARRTVHLAETRYEDGLTDFQDVVDAERSLVNLETSLVQSRGQIAVYLISLYKALGGGWTDGVIPQEEYLEAPSKALDEPLDYFFEGGKTELPWGKTKPEQAAPVIEEQAESESTSAVGQSSNVADVEEASVTTVQ